MSFALPRDIATFPFSPTQRSKLSKAGFRNASNFQDVGPVELAKDINVSHQEALDILKIVRGTTNTPLEGRSALELLQRETRRASVITFNQGIDQMLGGSGVPCGKTTEFCGVPGIGKTQMGIQLAVDVHIPAAFDGAEGECIYVDSEGSFVLERVVEVAEALVGHLRDMTARRSQEEQAAARRVTVESILAGTYYYRVHDYVEQIALVNILPNLLQQHPKVKMVVIDSVAFHFRHDFDDFALRSRLLGNMAQCLASLAEQHDLAVVLMNQMTTKIGDGGESSLVPALGESWGHSCTNRVILYWRDGCRYAHLYKSPTRQAATVPYQVVGAGIR